MSYEGFYGWESSAVWYYPGWRCIHCGDVVDSIISLNRSLNSEQNKSEPVSKKSGKMSSSVFDMDRHRKDHEYAPALEGAEADDDF
jgi:hypothetical protein